MFWLIKLQLISGAIKHKRFNNDPVDVSGISSVLNPGDADDALDSSHSSGSWFG